MASTTIDQPLSQKLGFDPGYLEEFEAKVFNEGAKKNRRLINFFVLLILATVIATYGVLSNSTATVIGAMIVAPLMGPIMATAAAVIMGSSQRAWRSLVLVVLGVICVILLSALLTTIVPGITISFTNNDEIASRISPGLLALFTALGAGAAGAFITSRAEIADSMGGVAIAISLVPPLCVVGIAISKGNWLAAGGALLLFLTNFFAILFAGGLVFTSIGLGRLAFEETQKKLRHRSFVLITLGTLLVAIPLFLTGYRSIVNTIDTNKATAVVNEWLQDSTDQIVAVSVNGQLVAVSIEGVDLSKSVDELALKMEEALQRPVTLRLRVIATKIEMAQSQSSP
jgi:uncharacterized hydrophobic protein (TIGR00271 family)